MGKSAVALLALFAPAALAHWNYNRLIHNDEIVGLDYQYIRETDNGNGPILDVSSPDIVCNSGGLSGANTETYAVAAGDRVGFTIVDVFGHPGPQQAWLSRAPTGTNVSDYDGGGDWVRVYSVGVNGTDEANEQLTWATNGVRTFEFALPDQLPAGEYLLRAEAIALHEAGKVGGAQFYLGCAQLSVDSSVTSEPSWGDSAVQLPGGYTGEEPGILYDMWTWPTPTSYEAPGPALWPAGTEEATEVQTIETCSGWPHCLPGYGVPRGAAQASSVDGSADGVEVGGC